MWMKSSLSIISSVEHVFGALSKKPSPYPRSPCCLLCHLLGILWCCVLHWGLWFPLRYIWGGFLDSCFCLGMFGCSSTTYGRDSLFFTVFPLFLCRRSVAYTYASLFLSHAVSRCDFAGPPPLMTGAARRSVLMLGSKHPSASRLLSFNVMLAVLFFRDVTHFTTLTGVQQSRVGYSGSSASP